MPNRKIDLRGKRALISGGAAPGPWALSVAEAFARRGCAIDLAAADQDALESAAARLGERFEAEVEAHPTDLTQSVNAAVLALECEDAGILINDPGAMAAGPVEEIDAQAWRQCWEQNINGLIGLTGEVYETMRERTEGSIVNLISSAGTVPDSGNICLSTASAALIMFTRSLGQASIRHGVGVAGILIAPQSPRLDEVGELAVFLASGMAAELSGAVITVDEGLALKAEILGYTSLH